LAIGVVLPYLIDARSPITDNLLVSCEDDRPGDSAAARTTQGPTAFNPEGCRAAKESPGSQWPLPAIAFALFIVGFLAANHYITNVDVADKFDHVDAEFKLWCALIGAIGGFALASVLYFAVWLVGAVRLSTQVDAKAIALRVLAVLAVFGIVVALLFRGNGSEPAIAHALTKRSRPITVIVGLCLTPGLVMFLALQAVAKCDGDWQESDRCQMLLILRLRRELRRLLSVFGAFLTLLVITTGMRRHALIAFRKHIDAPPEGVLLYGLVWAAVLGLFYIAANSEIDARANRLIDRLADVPDPNDGSFSDQLRRRAELSGVLGNGGPWRMFETTVVIAAPLLSALIGSATR
jgi:hypothetical protein